MPFWFWNRLQSPSLKWPLLFWSLSVAGRSQFWLHVGTVSLTCFSLLFIITVIHNGLPQRTLPLCQTLKLKCLCSVERQSDPAHLWMTASKKRLTHPFPDSGHSQTGFVRLKALFTLLSHCLSLIFPDWLASQEYQGSWLAKPNVLLSPSFLCSPHDRPINQEMRRWGKEYDFIWKASRYRRY